MSALQVAATVLWPLLLGAGWMRSFDLPRRLDPLAWWGWTWCVGSLATGLVVYTVALLDVPLASVTWVVPLCTLAVWAFALWRPRRSELAAPDPPASLAATASPLERRLFQAVVGLALALALHRVLTGSLLGVVGDDELFLWARKAKLIFTADGLNARFEALASATGDPLKHPDYPLLNPLLQVWVFAHAGEVTHFASRLPIQGFAFALVLVAASAFRRQARPALAALLLLVVVTLPQMTEFMRRASADLMVGVGLLMAGDALLRMGAAGRDNDDATRRSAWRITCLGLAVMLWSKNEGMLYLAALVAGVLLSAGSIGRVRGWVLGLGRQWIWAAAPLAICVLHQATNASFSFRNDLLAGDEYDKPFFLIAIDRAGESLPIVASYFWNTVFLDPVSNHWLLALFALSTLLAPRIALERCQRAATLAAIFVVCGFFLVYVGTPKGGGAELRALLPPGEGARWHLNNSAPRLFAQITPALALVLAMRLRRLSAA